MIAEYALEPEMVAAWGDRFNHRFFIREFGLGSGRLVSRYPKKWAKKVWRSFAGGSPMERKRLEELLVRLQETMIKRKDFVWDDTATWLENVVQEHARYPFKAIMAKNNSAGRTEILCEDALAELPCPGWDRPHGMTVNRKAPDMAAAVKQALACCRWVKFIDPYFSKCKHGHKKSLKAFFSILKRERPVGPPEKVEIHTSWGGTTADYLNGFYKEIVPLGMTATIFQWQERPSGQRLHNRYILTDLGGVSFLHGLDIGADGETDDIALLERAQYISRCRLYDPTAQAFEQAADPLVIVGRC